MVENSRTELIPVGKTLQDIWIFILNETPQSYSAEASVKSCS